MRRKDLNRKQKNILIGSLLAVVVLMAVGYAAFSTSLNINGTASVSSTWDIKITSVTAKNVVGSASNNTNVTTYSNLSATVAANLVSPGDSISYDIVVTNNGSVAAKLDSITGPTSNNAAITMSKSGLTAGDTISAGSTKTLTVTIGYSSSVTSQPNSTTAASTISLSFSQYVAPSITYVYAWNTDPVNYSHYEEDEYIEGSSLSEITTYNIAQDTYNTTSYFNDFAAMNAVNNINVGLKYGIENGLVTEAYVCFIYSSGEETCLKGSTDGSTYAANKAAMQAFSTGSKGSCSTCDSDFCMCWGGVGSSATLTAWAYSDGTVDVDYVNVLDNLNCEVDYNSNGFCEVLGWTLWQ